MYKRQALERWLLPAYQRVFANVFNGNLDAYDPWNAAHRTEVEEYTVEDVYKRQAAELPSQAVSRL